MLIVALFQGKTYGDGSKKTASMTFFSGGFSLPVCSLSL